MCNIKEGIKIKLKFFFLMKEPDCATFVNRDRETYRQTITASQPTIDNRIDTFTDKQTNMESDNKWNKLSMD